MEDAVEILNERIAKLEAERDTAIKEMRSMARKCGYLESKVDRLLLLLKSYHEIESTYDEIQFSKAVSQALDQSDD